MAVLVVHSHHLMEQSENADAVVMATQFPHLMGKSESDEDPKTNIKKRGNWKSTTTHCYNIFNSATECTANDLSLQVIFLSGFGSIVSFVKEYMSKSVSSHLLNLHFISGRSISLVY